MPREFSIVLIPSSTPADKIGDAVRSLLNPHARDFARFEPYRIPCINCVEGSEDGISMANQQVGDFHRLWHAFQSLPASQRPQWKDYIAEWEEVAITSTLTGPYHRQLDPQCSMCGGTGIALVRFPASGIRYEWRVMRESEWVNLGAAKYLIEKSDDFEILVTPDGQAYHRWDGQSPSKEQWKKRTQEILSLHKDCIAIQVLINI
jgi:hypothetical protein